MTDCTILMQEDSLLNIKHLIGLGKKKSLHAPLQCTIIIQTNVSEGITITVSAIVVNT